MDPTEAPSHAPPTNHNNAFALNQQIREIQIGEAARRNARSDPPPPKGGNVLNHSEALRNFELSMSMSMSSQSAAVIPPFPPPWVPPPALRIPPGRLQKVRHCVLERLSCFKHLPTWKIACGHHGKHTLAPETAQSGATNNCWCSPFHDK